MQLPLAIAMHLLMAARHTLHRAADEKVKKSEQAGTLGQGSGGAKSIDSFPEDVSTIVVHHSSILRDKRLLMAYRSASCLALFRLHYHTQNAVQVSAYDLAAKRLPRSLTHCEKTRSKSVLVCVFQPAV